MSMLVSYPAFTYLAGSHRSLNKTRSNGIFIKFKGEGGTPEYKAQVNAFVSECKTKFSPPQANAIYF